MSGIYTILLRSGLIFLHAIGVSIKILLNPRYASIAISPPKEHSNIALTICWSRAVLAALATAQKGPIHAVIASPPGPTTGLHDSTDSTSPRQPGPLTSSPWQKALCPLLVSSWIFLCLCDGIVRMNGVVDDSFEAATDSLVSKGRLNVGY